MKKRLQIGLSAMAIVMSLAPMALADVDFSTVLDSVLGYVSSAFAAAGALLAIIYGAPVAWRFIKRLVK